MIELKNVTKKYFTYQAIRDISIILDSGKVIGIIGENGSGKTTLLKLLAGLLRPSKGSVQIDSTQVSRKISWKLSYLTDMDYYFPYFTVEELILFYQSQFADFDQERAFDITSFMKLSKQQKVKHLSKGNKSRLKIAVTLARKAPYIVLDEPFSGLDPIVRKAIINGIIKYVDLNDQSIIIATHELNEVEPILDEVVLLKRGKIVGHKDVEHIREEYGMSVVEWMEHV